MHFITDNLLKSLMSEFCFENIVQIVLNGETEVLGCGGLVILPGQRRIFHDVFTGCGGSAHHGWGKLVKLTYNDGT